MSDNVPIDREPTTSARLAAVMLGDVEHELATTRRVLERLPAGHFGWRPHARSWTLGELATHVARLPNWGAATIDGTEFDLASIPPAGGMVAASPAALLALFDENAAILRECMRALLAGAPGEQLAASWTLRHGAQVIAELPRAVALRSFSFNHLVHHRAHLGLYLRLLDLPVPPMYGPTADER